jgi:predicted transcriptional regulator
MLKDMETKTWKKKGKDEPTHLLLLAIQLNGIESLQQNTNMQINNKIKTITQNLPVHQYLVSKIAQPRAFCFQAKLKE